MVYDKIHELTAQGVGLRERWRTTDGLWERSRYKYVVQRMRWEERDGAMHGAFE